jgi:biopolymer transport protein ExbD
MGRPDTRNIDRHNVRVVEISPRGDYWLQGRHLSLLQVEGELARMHNDNPRLIVDIRADKRTQWDFVIAVINSCLRNNITQFSARVAAAEHP